MGRGLSPLQKFILVAALEKANKLPGSDNNTYPNYRHCCDYRSCYGVLRPKDVLVGFYGFTPISADYSFNPQGARDFVMSEEGENRYRAASVAVRKAFLRLEARGLVKLIGNSHYWKEYNGIVLTTAGEELAARVA